MVAAILNGELQLNNFIEKSTQPDIEFLNVLGAMQINYKVSNSCLYVNQQRDYLATEVNLKNCPDLFPVLSVLCSFARGESRLFGAPHLVNKESDRINTTLELLQKAGVNCKKLPNGILITGNPHLQPKCFEFDCKKDHRLAMAAGLFMLKGFDINLMSKKDVNKSFPDFWQIIGLEN